VIIADICSFQFHYGSVKRMATKSVNFKRVRFQFHYGSVKRKWTNIGLSPVDNFNSTMVRLKGFAYRFIRIDFENFNSTMVRLKEKPNGVIVRI